MIFSPYDPNDIVAIKNVFHKTFSDSEGEEEGKLIGDLTYELMSKTKKEDLLGFVATENEEIVGCIFFSKMTFKNDINAFILSPVAVKTDYQKQGIGQKLINFGLKSLKENAVELVLTYGDPNYYSKVGFELVSEKVLKAPLKLSYPEGWLGQSLNGDKIKPIKGNSSCVDALNKQVYW